MAKHLSSKEGRGRLEELLLRRFEIDAPSLRYSEKSSEKAIIPMPS
ncbi:MAG: hypothetical protein MCM46_10835 [Candidatus Manganitrophus sp. SB1]|nr:hypothetical protein [Candidatus Manganitrophus morganii]